AFDVSGERHAQRCILWTLRPFEARPSLQHAAADQRFLLVNVLTFPVTLARVPDCVRFATLAKVTAFFTAKRGWECTPQEPPRRVTPGRRELAVLRRKSSRACPRPTIPPCSRRLGSMPSHLSRMECSRALSCWPRC